MAEMQHHLRYTYDPLYKFDKLPTSTGFHAGFQPSTDSTPAREARHKRPAWFHQVDLRPVCPAR